MHIDLDKLLCARFPNLYADRTRSIQDSCMGWGFECGDGWFGLLWELSETLEPLIADMEGPSAEWPRAVQVKEKFGGLRFYMSHETDEMSAAIRRAEERSEAECETCGAAGSVVGGTWLTCLCPIHEKEQE